jgi:hypothetical protein
VLIDVPSTPELGTSIFPFLVLVVVSGAVMNGAVVDEAVMDEAVLTKAV